MRILTLISIALSGAASVNEGALYTLNLAASDPGHTIKSWSVNWGDGSPVQSVGGNPPTVTHTTHGFQYLTEGRYDQVASIMDVLRHNVIALGLPLRSIEVELGPSQFEFTFAPEIGMAPADAMVLIRSTLKQVAQRHGYLASLMCRPRLPNTVASGWHLHQSLLDKKSGGNAFVSKDAKQVLSPLGQNFLAGLLANARAATAFAAPTLNGYKRYHGINTMAPIQAVWAQDNRGVMVRVMGQPKATQVIVPYIQMFQAGLAPEGRPVGIFLLLGPTGTGKTKTVEALAALRTNTCFRKNFGDFFVDYYVRLKEAELTRYRSELPANADPAEVTEWEHREYFDML